MNDYESFRCKIKSGDVVVFSRPGIVTLFTKSPYSHVGLVWKISGRLFVLEAVAPYVRIVPLSNFAKEGFHVISMRCPMSKEETEFALSVVGMSRYSYVDCVKAYFKKLKVGEDNTYQCAEYLIACRSLSGIDIFSSPIPADIVRDATKAGYEITKIGGG